MLYGGDGGTRIAHELPGRIALRRVTDVDQVMRHTRARFETRFGAADVHAAIDQHRIDADDLHRQLRLQRRGQLYRQLALTAAGWPRQHQHRRRRRARIHAQRPRRNS